MPADQLGLNEAELKEEFQRLLTANDPNVPNNVTRFSYHKKEFKIDPPGPDARPDGDPLQVQGLLVPQRLERGQGAELLVQGRAHRGV